MGRMNTIGRQGRGNPFSALLGSSLLAHFDHGRRVYSDAAGTTPAVMGGAVRSVRSVVGSALAVFPAGPTWIANQIGGKPVIRMDGTVLPADVTLAISSSRDYAIFQVGRLAARSDGSAWCGTNNVDNFYGANSNFNAYLSTAAGATFSAGVLPELFSVVTWVCRAGTTKSRLNGADVSGASAAQCGTDAITALKLWGVAGGSNNFRGDAAACLVVSPCPTDAVCLVIERMLAQMYPQP